MDSASKTLTNCWPTSVSYTHLDVYKRQAETQHAFAGLSNEARTLVPKKALNEIQRLAGEAAENEQIEFARDESHLFFQLGDRLLISRILTGQFPNYEAVLPLSLIHI